MSLVAVSFSILFIGELTGWQVQSVETSSSPLSTSDSCCPSDCWPAQLALKDSLQVGWAPAQLWEAFRGIPATSSVVI
eukprot:753088-Hanusia_phi.AAC.16